MAADSTEELLAMADKIGLKRDWIQMPGTIYEHFDVTLSMKLLAIKAGAKPINWKQMGQMVHQRGIKAAENGDLSEQWRKEYSNKKGGYQ